MNIYFRKTHQRAFGTYPLTGDVARAAILAAAEVGYGLSNGFWDIICDTRIPIEIRRALYSNAPRQGGSRPPPSLSSF